MAVDPTLAEWQRVSGGAAPDTLPASLTRKLAPMAAVFCAVRSWREERPCDAEF
jgi:hypothetical protein